MIRLGRSDIAVALVAIACGGYILLMAAWVAGSGSEGISGGILFLPHEWNISIGRALFGFGAVLCMLGVTYALRRFFGSHK